MRLIALGVSLAALGAFAQDAGEPIIETTAPVIGLGPADAGAELNTPPAEPQPGEAAAVAPADAPVAASTGEAMAPPPAFVKGELSVYLGSDRLSVKRNRIGVSAGLDRFGQALYLLIEPQVDLRFLDAQLGIGIGVPLRLELVDLNNTSNPTQNLGRVRKEDWDSVHDFGRLLKYVNYGRKEDSLYINVGQRYSTTVGHGAMVRRYAPNIDIDYPRVSAEVDAYNHLGGFELFTNDILEWNQLNGLAFVKPFGFVGENLLPLKTLSIGVTAGLDRNAPSALKTNSLGVRQLEDGRLAADTGAIGLIGFDVETKVIKTEHVDLKPYADYTLMLGGEGGLTLGALGRFNVGTDIVNAFRVIAELRILGSRYQPSYFDTFYEVERFSFRQVGVNAAGLMNLVPKGTYVRDIGLGARTGYYFEASYGIRDAVGVTFALEGVTNDAAKNFVAHLEVPVLNFVQIFGSFYKRGFTSFGELFTPDEKMIAFAGARIRPLPFLFINGRLYKTFRVNPDSQRYDNQFGFVVDVEVGYEFGKARDEVKPEAAAPPSSVPATEATPPPGEGTPPADQPAPPPAS
ncbi:MAG: hypothetical protein K1X89_17790 [Myxococcaceae bacterium]|nr:hypothetical protein [Myxococcaceae bacterium]